MKPHSRKFLLVLPLLSALTLLLANCGGSSSGSGAGPNGPTAGEYLWETSGSDERLFYATVDTTTGQLGNPAASGGNACNSESTVSPLAVAPSDKFVFVLDLCFNSVRVYSVGGPGVVLTEAAGSPYTFVGAFISIAIDPKGKSLYLISEAPGALYQIPVDERDGALGTPTILAESADLREAIVHPSGKYIFVNDYTGGRIFAYLVGSGGSLSPVPGSPFNVPNNVFAVGLILDGNGSFLYVPLSSGGIAGFAVDSSTGALSNIPGSPFPTSNDTYELAASPSGKVLYALDSIGGGNTIEAFSIDSGNGALTAIAGSPFSAPLPLNGLTVDNSGSFLYASVNADTLSGAMIVGFSIDPSTGSLVTLPTSPYAAPPFSNGVISLNIPQ